jgi:hypothetical protein
MDCPVLFGRTQREGAAFVGMASVQMTMVRPLEEFAYHCYYILSFFVFVGEKCKAIVEKLVNIQHGQSIAKYDVGDNVISFGAKEP